MITWLGSPVRWLSQSAPTVNAKKWGWRGNCYAACELACRVGEYDVPIYGSVCAGQCYDQSGCADLQYGSEQEYDHAVAELEAKLGELAYNEAQKKKKPLPAPQPGVPYTPPPTPEKYPWKQFAQETKDLQEQVNKKLVAAGLCPIGTDGKLGAGTCGAAQHVGLSYPSTCLAFAAPKVCGTGPLPAQTAPPKPVAKSSTSGGFPVGLLLAGAAAIILVSALGRS